jgi:hypothetical protein
VQRAGALDRFGEVTRPQSLETVDDRAAQRNIALVHHLDVEGLDDGVAADLCLDAFVVADIVSAYPGFDARRSLR